MMSRRQFQKRGRSAFEWTGTDNVRRSVVQWAIGRGYCPIPEFQLSPKDRIDLLLVPVAYDAPIDQSKSTYNGDAGGWAERGGIIGVEIKSSRADAMAGLRKNQFERYRCHLNGLYLATPRGVLKADEVDREIGLLVCARRTDRVLTRSNAKRAVPYFACVCRRRAAIDSDLHIRDAIMFRAFQKVWSAARDHRIETEHALRQMSYSMGDRIERRVNRFLREEFKRMEERDNGIGSIEAEDATGADNAAGIAEGQDFPFGTS